MKEQANKVMETKDAKAELEKSEAEFDIELDLEKDGDFISGGPKMKTNKAVAKRFKNGTGICQLLTCSSHKK